MLNFYFALYNLCAECELDSLKGFHNSLKVQTFFSFDKLVEFYIKKVQILRGATQLYKEYN